MNGNMICVAENKQYFLFYDTIIELHGVARIVLPCGKINFKLFCCPAEGFLSSEIDSSAI